MAAGDRSQKTEKPTPKRLREAREKGQIARTPELATWTGMLVTMQLLHYTISHGAKTFTEIFDEMGRAVAKPDTAGATRFAIASTEKAMMLIAPLMIGLLIVAIIV